MERTPILLTDRAAGPRETVRSGLPSIHNDLSRPRSIHRKAVALIEPPKLTDTDDWTAS